MPKRDRLICGNVRIDLVQRAEGTRRGGNEAKTTDGKKDDTERQMRRRARPTECAQSLKSVDRLASNEICLRARGEKDN